MFPAVNINFLWLIPIREIYILGHKKRLIRDTYPLSAFSFSIRLECQSSCPVDILVNGGDESYGKDGDTAKCQCDCHSLRSANA